MVNIIATLIPWATLVSHILFGFLVLAYIFRNSWGSKTISAIREHGILMGVALTLMIVLGSLFYSSVMGYPPCELCWWQRVLLFPQLILFLVAWKRGDTGVFSYILPLSVLAGIVSAYQIYAQLGGVSLLDCTAAGGACSKVYVNTFGYITIPMMGLTAAAYLAFLAFVNKKHD